MKSLKIKLGSLLLVAACLMVPVKSMAQWSIGASYQIRNEDPKNGFGVRIERSILNPVPIIDIGLRAHFSYFDGDVGGSDLNIYDYGLAATGGFSLGLLKPYIGLGIGNSHAEYHPVGGDYDDSNFFWNSFIGAELSAIPMLHPFVEYRFEPSDEAGFGDNINSDGRLILGLLLSF